MKELAAHHESFARRVAQMAALRVSELYRSIQGESTHAGRPCVFIRLTGCPLRCVWCDSGFAFQGGIKMSLEEILRQVKTLGVGLVEVTGGEPLAQPDCLELLKQLCDADYEVLLETSGALDISGVDPRVVKIVDIKCPGSGEAAKNRMENLERLGPRDEIKFVLADRVDYEWARRVLAETPRLRGHALLFSPVHGQLVPADLAAWLLEDGLAVRLQIQIHKFIWPGRTQGI